MNFKLLRRQMGLLVLSSLVGHPILAASAMPRIEVWKTPTCECCNDWVSHLEANGFLVRVHDTGNNSVRNLLKIPAKFGSCHTAKVAGYVIEGHVPAQDIQRLLTENPEAIGLAVPGMPVGSPGMDGTAYGGRRDPYDVLLIQADGEARVFQSHRGVGRP